MKIKILAILGLINTAYLTVVSLAGKGQCLLEGCSKVLSSAYADIAGIPLSLIGFSFYTFITLVLFLGGHKLLKWVMLFASFMFLGLIWIQWTVINAYCTFCLLTALATWLIMGLLFLEKKDPEKPIAPKFLLASAGLSLLIILTAALWPKTPTATLFKDIPPSKTTGIPKNPIKTFSKGNPNARYKIVIFSDIQCPYCRLAHEQLEKEIGAHPDYYMEYRFFPLSRAHSQAKAAAEAAICAEEQFWPYLDKLYANQDNLSENLYLSLAKEFSLNIETFNTCRKSEQTKNIINNDQLVGNLKGIQGTPTLFVNGRRLRNQ